MNKQNTKCFLLRDDSICQTVLLPFFIYYLKYGQYEEELFMSHGNTLLPCDPLNEAHFRFRYTCRGGGESHVVLLQASSQK